MRVRTSMWLPACGAHCAALTLFAALSPAYAQTPNTGALEEIVVTARRTAESQQDVPIAITALDQQALERNQIESLSDLQQFVPSASVTGYNSRNQEWFSLRGQG